jgi:hypothetical protein
MSPEEFREGLAQKVKDSVKNIADDKSIKTQKSAVWKSRMIMHTGFALAISVAILCLLLRSQLEIVFVDNSLNSWGAQEQTEALELELLHLQLANARRTAHSLTEISNWDENRTVKDEDAALVQHFDRNDAIAAFIGVTSLVFALIFASTYTDAQSRLNEIRNSLAQEAGGVHLAMLLVRTLEDTDPSDTYKTRVLLLLASYIDHLAQEISWLQGGAIGEQPTPSSIETLYAAIPFLSQIGSDGDGDEMDRVLVQRTVDLLNSACQARQIRVSQERRNISPYVYGFLLQMALMTYFGVLFLHAGSAALNSAVCLATLLTLTTAMMILADLAQPYKGFVQVDTNIFSSIRTDISLVLSEEEPQEGDGAPNQQWDSAHPDFPTLGGSGKAASALRRASSPSINGVGSKWNGVRNGVGGGFKASFRGIDPNYHLRQAVRRMSDGIPDCIRDGIIDHMEAGAVSSVSGGSHNFAAARNGAPGPGLGATLGGAQKGSAAKYLPAPEASDSALPAAPAAKQTHPASARNCAAVLGLVEAP